MVGVFPMSVSSSLLALVDPSFRALYGRLKFTVRRHKFNQEFLPLSVAPLYLDLGVARVDGALREEADAPLRFLACILHILHAKYYHIYYI